MSSNEIKNAEKTKEDIIKKENKKALKVFVPSLVVCGLIGGVFGFFSGSKGIQNFGDVVGEGLKNAMDVCSPYMVIITALLAIVFSYYYYNKAAKIFKNYKEDDESEANEEIFEQADQVLEKCMISISIGTILQFMFFGISFVGIEENIENRTWLFIATIIAFLAGTLVITKQQQKAVDLVKIMNPDKRGSAYDVNFTKKWEDSCDEMEKMMIYKAAYRSYKATTLAYCIAWILLTIGSMVFHYGSLSIIVVTILWLVTTLSYFTESRKLGKK